MGGSRNTGLIAEATVWETVASTSADRPSHGGRHAARRTLPPCARTMSAYRWPVPLIVRTCVS